MATIKELLDLNWQESVGKGAYGEVWKAEWKKVRKLPHLNLTYKKCAVKKMEINRPQDANLITREIDVWKNLHHENIVQFYEDLHKDSCAYIFMEYLPGGSLNSYMNEQGPHDVDLALVFSFGLDICNAIQYLHQRDIVHRDIKPGNLLLAKTDKQTDFLKLCDYGLAREFLTSDVLTAVGTVLYMPPEFLRHRQDQTAKEKHERMKGPDYDVTMSKTVDIYSIGVVLNELPTFRQPYDDLGKANPLKRGGQWRKCDVFSFIRGITDYENPIRPTKSREINSKVPKEYQILVEQCWADLNEKRPLIDDVITKLTEIRDDYFKKELNVGEDNVGVTRKSLPVPKSVSEAKSEISEDELPSELPPKPDVEKLEPKSEVANEKKIGKTRRRKFCNIL